MNLYKDERCLIFDESGNMGKSGRYFVISCIDTRSYKALHNIMKRKLKEAKLKFPELDNNSNELKSSVAYPAIKYHIVESIAKKDLTISYIVADLNHVRESLLKEKNLLYNYMMKLLLENLISNEDEGSRLNILCDNHTTKVASTNSLSDYIKATFLYEKGIDMELNIRLIDSDASDAFVIQAADFIANSIYSYYEYDKSHNYEVIKPRINVIERFPRQKFGKAP